MGHIMVPLDETLALVAVDVGGRPYAVIKTPFQDSHIGDLPSDLVRHFLEVFALEGRLNLHAEILYGANEHHKAEALFKALARGDTPSRRHRPAHSRRRAQHQGHHQRLDSNHSPVNQPPSLLRSSCTRSTSSSRLPAVPPSRARFSIVSISPTAGP